MSYEIQMSCTSEPENTNMMGEQWAENTNMVGAVGWKCKYAPDHIFGRPGPS